MTSSSTEAWTTSSAWIEQEPVADLQRELFAAVLALPHEALQHALELGAAERPARPAAPTWSRLRTRSTVVREPARLDRLEQVVDGVHLERLDRVLVVGRHEDDLRLRMPARSSRRATSNPVRPGIWTSSMTRSGPILPR